MAHVRTRSLPGLRVALVLGTLSAAAAGAAPAGESGSPLEAREFFRPELAISTANRPLADVLAELPNRAAWEVFLRRHSGPGSGQVSAVFVDPRSGAATNVIGSFPLIPGDGAGNAVTTALLSRRLGRTVERVDEEAVGQAVLQFVRAHATLLGIDTAQLGAVRARAASAELWHVRIPQAYRGLPVRHGHLVAVVSHGNLVTLGTESWGDVHLDDLEPRVGAPDALAAGFAFADGRRAGDVMLREPALEIVPFAPPEHQKGEAFAGPLGAGYGHRLVWTFLFQRRPDLARWEVTVDARDGAVIAFEDRNQSITKRATGGVYPITSTEVCPTPQTCGTMQTGWPMPFADTGLAAPNNFTNSAGNYDYTSGTATSTLSGRFLQIADGCGPISLGSPTGDLAFGGANGDHDCETPGFGGGGNTASARTVYYELNKIREQAGGWLPVNTWLQGVLQANVNHALTCSAFWNGSTVNFYRSGGGCRNAGEIASAIDHEWGHGLDDNDTGGVLSNSTEAYADIAANYRLQASCVAYGLNAAIDQGCGAAPDGSGMNANEAQLGPVHCDLECSGLRDADWARHNPNTPDTPTGFVCTSCASGSGPCGRVPVCAAAPARQAAWDLVARDLRTPPFSYDSQTAFIVGNKLFYQGSGLIGAWHSCTCGGASDGCGATNGYMQWLAADDDNGNLADGTPHMTALFAAFNRHQIACATPAPQNAGCPAGPAAPPGGFNISPGNQQINLTWNAAPGATRYWVFRTEGVADCDFGKTLLAQVTNTGYVDTAVAAGRFYWYNVVAAGAVSACFSSASDCLGASPVSFSVAPSGLAVDAGGNGVLQPNETAVAVAPVWRNTGQSPIGLVGVLGAFTGPPGPAYTIDDPVANYGTIVTNASQGCSDCYAVTVSASARPAVHWDATVQETVSPTSTTKTWTLHVGDSFADVPAGNPFYRFVETLLHEGITGGCAADTYCPGTATTREQMAAFVLTAKEGAGYNPPACAPPNLFADVPETSLFCKFIEELAERGVVGGCAPNQYCPSSPVLRNQMAVFVLRTLDPALNPPACATPRFADVPASDPFCKWIEELARRNVVTGCTATDYCPNSPVTRDQMGVFLGLTFGLTLYGL